VKDSFYGELERVFDKFPKSHMNILLGDFHIKIHLKISESKVRCSHIATYINIRTWISPDGKTHNQICPVLIDRQRHSSALDIQSFRTADCDTDHYLVVEKVRERLAVNTERSHKFLMKRFSIK
jgi:hypothetical protein